MVATDLKSKGQEGNFAGQGGGPMGNGDGFTGVKVFSANKAESRVRLGEEVTSWLCSNPGVELADKVVVQSSDDTFHCLSIVLFFRGQPGSAQTQGAGS